MIMKLSTLTVLGVLAFACPAAADDFIVNSTRDLLDDVEGDRICSTGVTLPSGELECTLRAALQEANGLGGLAHTIRVPEGLYRLTVHAVSQLEEEDNQLSLMWDAEDAVRTGDLDIDTNVVITGDGEGRTIIDGARLGRVFDVLGRGVVTISQLTVRNGLSVRFGGCIQNVDIGTIFTLHHVTIEDCASPESIGGGIYNNGFVFMERVTVRRNRATRGGGLENSGVARINESTFDGNHSEFTPFGGGNGGGIANLSVHGASPTLELNNSAIINNVAVNGGGLYNQSRVSIGHSTLSGNVATRGGAIRFDEAIRSSGDEILYMRYTTIAANSAGAFGSAIFRGGTRQLTLSHVLINDNLTRGVRGLSCEGGVTDSNHSLEDGNSCGLVGDGDLPDTNAGLRRLTDNGGPTLTHSIPSDSPAVDAGVPLSTLPGDNRDQRGTLRPLGSATDIGAFEFGIDPRRLMFLIPVRFTQLFPGGIVPGVTTPYQIDLSMHGGSAPPPKGDGAGGGGEARMMGVMAGDFQGQLQFSLDKDGRRLTVIGVVEAVPPSDNPNAPPVNDPVLFYVEVRRSIHGAAQLRVDDVTCQCSAAKNVPPFVIPPYQPNQ